MKRIVRLTENDLTRIVKRVLKEQSELNPRLEKLYTPQFLENILIDRYFRENYKGNPKVNNVSDWLFDDLKDRDFSGKFEEITNAVNEESSLQTELTKYKKWLTTIGLSASDVYVDKNNRYKIIDVLRKSRSIE